MKIIERVFNQLQRFPKNNFKKICTIQPGEHIFANQTTTTMNNNAITTNKKPITIDRLNRVILSILNSPNKSYQRGAMWAKLATMRSQMLDGQLTEMSKTVITFFEGSHCFNRIETTLNVSPDFIEMKLAKQYEFRPTTESLWAIINRGGIETGRFQLKFGEGLIKL